jgi:hypothetical protein
MDCPRAKQGINDETWQVNLHLRKRNMWSQLCRRQLRLSPGHPRVLQFLETNIWSATHRDTRIPSYLRHTRPPPRPKKTAWLDSQPRPYIFYGIMVVNGVVFIAWRWASIKYVCLTCLPIHLADKQQSQGDPGAMRFMKDNFSSSLQNFSSGRVFV